MFGGKNKLEEWMGIPLTIETSFGNVEGTIQYGIRLPLRPGTVPLIKCEVGSREKIDGEKPRYWFVDEEQSLKIKLITKKVDENKISGCAYDTHLFKYTIRRKP